MFDACRYMACFVCVQVLVSGHSACIRHALWMCLALEYMYMYMACLACVQVLVRRCNACTWHLGGPCCLDLMHVCGPPSVCVGACCMDMMHLRASAGSIMQFLVNGSITPGK